MKQKNFLRLSILSAVGLLLAVGGCRREDVRELTVTVPGLTPGNRATVAEALSRYQGICRDSYVEDGARVAFKWDFAAKTVTLRYDSMQLAETNIRMAIADRGIEVEFPENVTGRAGH